VTAWTKAALRRALLDARRERGAFDLTLARISIAAHVRARAASQGWESVAAYRPLPTEPGSDRILDELRADGIRVITPVLLADKDLDWTTEPDVSDRLGVDAIRDVDAILVPALAVSRSGLRLGRGGGSYDRVLARLGDGFATYALLFDSEILDEVPADPWDRPVHSAITPAGIVRLSGAEPGLDGE
jgi:5-formyltetrahydrofolate cyclo-ligase